MLHHFEFRGEHGWEAFGSGEGTGPDAPARALADLRSLAGGALPPGEYRCLPATSAQTRWVTLFLEADGRIRLEG